LGCLHDKKNSRGGGRRRKAVPRPGPRTNYSGSGGEVWPHPSYERNQGTLFNTICVVEKRKRKKQRGLVKKKV